MNAKLVASWYNYFWTTHGKIRSKLIWILFFSSIKATIAQYFELVKFYSVWSTCVLWSTEKITVSLKRLRWDLTWLELTWLCSTVAWRNKKWNSKLFFPSFLSQLRIEYCARARTVRFEENLMEFKSWRSRILCVHTRQGFVLLVWT